MKFGLTQYTLDVFFEKVLAKYPAQPALALVGKQPFIYGEFALRVSALKTRLNEELFS